MEKEIVWTAAGRRDFWEIVAYLKEEWPDNVFEKFSSSLELKIQLLLKQPGIGFRSSKILASEKL